MITEPDNTLSSSSERVTNESLSLFFLNVYQAHATGQQDHRCLNKKKVVTEMLRLLNLAQKYRSKAANYYYQLANAW